MGVEEGPRGAPPSAGRGGEARPPQTGYRARPVLVPGRDRLRPGRVPPEGRPRSATDGGLLAPAARAGRLRVGVLAAHPQESSLPDLRSSRLVRRRLLPADGARRRSALLPQADELPVPRADLPKPA